MPADCSRRAFLQTASLALGVAVAPGALSAAPPGKKLRLAAINSIFRLRSHAYHILGRLVHGFQKDGVHHQPQVELVRMYDDQQPEADLGPDFCERHAIELCAEPAAVLGPGKTVDVDGLLIIVEHGDYPLNERNQVLYPRHEMFMKAVERFQAAGKSVPIFVDKHLSYDYQKAAEMVSWSEKLKFGLMAGSSLPVTWRLPQIEPPRETPFTEAVVTFGFDRGAPEIYLFHALETLQCLLERRRGGETGVKSVVCLAGDDVWKAAEAGKFSLALVQEALARSPSANVGPLRENVLKPMAILVEYRDGVKGAVLNLIEQTSDFAFAGKVAGRAEPLSTCFYLPTPPGARFFDPLTWHIEQFLRSGVGPYPVQRTLLTSTVLDFAVRTLHEKSGPRTDPALDIRYQAPESTGFFRGPIADKE